jgi:putative cell wall-binding protein
MDDAMKRIRPLAIVATALVAAALLTPAAAQAVTPGAITISPAYLSYTNGQPSGAVPLDPSNPGASNGVEVVLWKLDGATNTYVTAPEPTWSGTLGANWSTAVDPGTYRLQFVPFAPSVASGYWTSGGAVPFFSDAADVVVASGGSSDIYAIQLTQQRAFTTDRIFGSDRFETAAHVSQTMFPDPVTSPPEVVYVGNGYNYPDALAAGPAAIAKNAPLLLTAPTYLPGPTADELARLHPGRVVIVGGASAVSDSVASAIGAAAPGATVDRLGGADRYETARMIVQEAFSAGGSSVALVATGRNYPDALAAGPAAGHMGSPVILLDGGASTIPQSTIDLMDALGVQFVGIVGGINAVSAGIESQLGSKFGAQNVARFSGATRYETAADLNFNVFTQSDYAYFASGVNFPDALAGAPLAGYDSAPLYLTPPTCEGGAAAQGVEDLHVNGITLLGGTAALSADVENLQLCADAGAIDLTQDRAPSDTFASRLRAVEHVTADANR